jgi:hypothetical protein
MTESERRLHRQAEWQKSRQSLPWSEKIRLAEQMRPTVEAFGEQRDGPRPSGSTAASAQNAGSAPSAATRR